MSAKHTAAARRVDIRGNRDHCLAILPLVLLVDYNVMVGIPRECDANSGTVWTALKSTRSIQGDKTLEFTEQPILTFTKAVFEAVRFRVPGWEPGSLANAISMGKEPGSGAGYLKSNSLKD